jgi:hypothetical protein
MTKRKRVHISKEVLAAALSLNAQRGGKARADRLSPERRREIALMGVAARIEKYGYTVRKASARKAVLAAKARRSAKARVRTKTR